MRWMHHGFVLLGLVALATGCGSSGTETPIGPGDSGVLLAGKVVSVDGSTQSLGGVQIVELDSDQAAESDGTGTFQLRARAGQRLRLRFDAVNNTGPMPLGHSPDIDEDKDHGKDDQDIDGDVVEIGPFGDGERCDIEVELAGGQVVECWVEHGGDRERVGGGEAPMGPPDFPDGMPCRGEVEISCDGDCCSIEVEVGGFEEAGVFEVVLVNKEGEKASLGDFVVDEDGVGHFEWETCKGDALPFDVEDARELAGVEILLVDDAGNVVLVGRLPGKGPHHDDEDRCHGVAFLKAPDGSDSEAKGLLATKAEGDCSALWLEVFRATGMDELELWIHDPDSDAVASLGTFEVGEHGLGHLVLEICSSADLPFGAETLADLAGAAVTVEDAEGTVLLEGELPSTDQGDCKGPPAPPPPPGDEFALELLPPDDSPEPDAFGKLFYDCEKMSCDLVVEVEGFSGAQTLTVLFVVGDTTEELGSLDVDDDGTGRGVLDLGGGGAGPDDDMPRKGDMPDMPPMPPMPEPIDLLFQLQDADGAVVLEGKLQGPGPKDHGDKDDA